MDYIVLQEVIAILNGEGLESFETFRENFDKEFEGFVIPKSNLVKKILEHYPINFKLNQCQNIYSNMKSSSNKMCIKRNAQ